MIHTYTIPCLDLAQIDASGQCFRMTCRKDGWWQILTRDRQALARQSGPDQICLDCPPGEEAFWLSYFDCDTDYPQIIQSIDPEDAYLRAAAHAGSGIRILRQDPWEMIITFVISQQKTIPHIRQLTQALCRRYGSPLKAKGSQEDPLFAFPRPDQLAAASLEELLDLKLGYRAKYIYQLSQDAYQERLDLTVLSSMDYPEAMKYLTGFYGIGKKVANCICLFGLHHIQAFPVDTWIEKILMRQYYQPKKYRRTPKTRLLDQLVQDNFGKYDGYAGVLQQYIFYYERMGLFK